MKAIIDAEACIGCGLCIQACPEVFEMDDDNIARVKVTPVPVEVEATCRDAAVVCPTEAIKLES